MKNKRTQNELAQRPRAKEREMSQESDDSESREPPKKKKSVQNPEGDAMEKVCKNLTKKEPLQTVISFVVVSDSGQQRNQRYTSQAYESSKKTPT